MSRRREPTELVRHENEGTSNESARLAHIESLLQILEGSNTDDIEKKKAAALEGHRKQIRDIFHEIYSELTKINPKDPSVKERLTERTNDARIRLDDYIGTDVANELDGDEPTNTNETEEGAPIPIDGAEVDTSLQMKERLLAILEMRTDQSQDEKESMEALKEDIARIKSKSAYQNRRIIQHSQNANDDEPADHTYAFEKSPPIKPEPIQQPRPLPRGTNLEGIERYRLEALSALESEDPNSPHQPDDRGDTHTSPPPIEKPKTQEAPAEPEKPTPPIKTPERNHNTPSPSTFQSMAKALARSPFGKVALGLAVLFGFKMAPEKPEEPERAPTTEVSKRGAEPSRLSSNIERGHGYYESNKIQFTDAERERLRNPEEETNLTYTVKPGDSLWEIVRILAGEHGIDEPSNALLADMVAAMRLDNPALQTDDTLYAEDILNVSKAEEILKRLFSKQGYDVPTSRKPKEQLYTHPEGTEVLSAYEIHRRFLEEEKRVQRLRKENDEGYKDAGYETKNYLEEYKKTEKEEKINNSLDSSSWLGPLKKSETLAERVDTLTQETFGRRNLARNAVIEAVVLTDSGEFSKHAATKTHIGKQFNYSRVNQALHYLEYLSPGETAEKMGVKGEYQAIRKNQQS